MSETSREAYSYLLEHPEIRIDHSRPLMCACGNVIGYEVKIGEVWMLLRPDGNIDWTTHGFCRVCGKDYHWTQTDRLLKEVLRLSHKNQEEQ